MNFIYIYSIGIGPIVAPEESLTSDLLSNKVQSGSKSMVDIFKGTSRSSNKNGTCKSHLLYTIYIDNKSLLPRRPLLYKTAQRARI